MRIFVKNLLLFGLSYFYPIITIEYCDTLNLIKIYMGFEKSYKRRAEGQTRFHSTVG